MFRFKNADSGAQSRNSELVDFSFFLNDHAAVHLDDSNEADSLCSNFKAADFSHSRNRRALRDQTGIFGLFCARHGTPIFFVDMYKGEKFGYLDYLLSQLLKDYGQNREVHLFHDINCRYAVNFRVSAVRSLAKNRIE